jgi:predicted N-formylglutamate amidohydrolase
MKKPDKQTAPLLMLTCEHASNRLPATFKKMVPAEVLKTHRAYDIGAVQVFRKLVRFAKPEFSCEGKFSRLLVDLNRTITNKSAFSDYLRNNAKAKVQATAYWTEYRAAIEKFVESSLKPKTTQTIVHLGIHSFTPELNGKVRNTDIGILYDPACPQECAYANVIKAEIKRLYPDMKVRFNYPYKGTTDGLTTTLRKKFGPRYVGIEIEINQKFFK